MRLLFQSSSDPEKTDNPSVCWKVMEEACLEIKVASSSQVQLARV